MQELQTLYDEQKVLLEDFAKLIKGELLIIHLNCRYISCIYDEFRS